MRDKTGCHTMRVNKKIYRKNIYVIYEDRDSVINDTINNVSDDKLRISYHTYKEDTTAEIKCANEHISDHRKPHMAKAGQRLYKI